MDARMMQQDRVQQQYATVSEFAQSILSDIESTPVHYGGDVFVRVESRESIERLAGFLTALKNIHIAPSSESLKPLRNFLEQRWQSIRKTDAIYSHQPNSQINRLCFLLAQKLAVYHDVHPFELLMPTAVGFMNYFPHHTAASVKLTEFIMRDNDKPLHIMDAFALLERDISPAHSINFSLHAHVSERLSLNEERLLSKHSPAAEGYFRALKARVTQPHVRQAAKEILDKFMKDIPVNHEPQSTYGVTGKKKLAKLILDYVGDRKKLVALFAHKIPLSEWLEFQAVIVDDDYFRYMGMSGVEIQRESIIEMDAVYNTRRFKQIEQSLNALLMPPSNRALNELNDILLVVHDAEAQKNALRAYCYCLLQLYKRIRSSKPEATSIVGQYMPSFYQLTSYGCSKEEKLSACDAVEKILIGSPTLADISRAFESDEMRAHQKAIQEGQLGHLVCVVKNVIDKACALEDPRRRRDWVRTAAN